MRAESPLMNITSPSDIASYKRVFFILFGINMMMVLLGEYYVWKWNLNQMPLSSVRRLHYNDVIMSAMASQITSLTIVYSIVYLSADQRKHQSSALLAFVRGIHRRPVNSPHKGPETRKMFPFDDVIMGMLSMFYNIYTLFDCTLNWRAYIIKSYGSLWFIYPYPSG